MTNVEEFSKFVYLEMEDATALIDLSRTVGIYFSRSPTTWTEIVKLYL